MVTIGIATFKEGVHQVELEPEAEALDLDPEKFEKINVSAYLDCRGRRILAHLDAEAVATMICDRTLKPFSEKVEGSYSVLFAPPEFGGAEAREGEYEEVRELEPNAREIDITDVLRDTLLLALPLRKVAPEAREADIKTAFGEPEGDGQEPIDPRWEKLRELRSDEDAE